MNLKNIPGFTIELDGEPHADLINIARDAERDEWLNQKGITVFRYKNRWVFEYPDVIKKNILKPVMNGIHH